jgi:hypothetical protein
MLMVKVVRPQISPTTVEVVGGVKHVDSGGRGQVNDSRCERVLMSSMVASSARVSTAYLL